MTTAEMFVDLGDMSSPPVSVAAGGPGWARIRFLRYAVPVLAVLLLVAGAGAGARDRSVPVVDAAIGGDARILIDGGTLFTLSRTHANTSATNTIATNTIAAYALAGGRHWSATVAEQPSESLLQVDGGSVLVTTSAVDTTRVNTESFDATTGRREWSSHLGTAFVTPGGILVTAAPVTSRSTNPSGYQLLDPGSGHAIWSIGVPGDCASKLTGGVVPTRLVEVCESDSSLRVVDLTDGRTLVARTIGLGHETGRAVVAPDEYLMTPSVTVAGTTILVKHMDAPTPTLDAYALADLRPLWGRVPALSGQDVQPCGDTVCLTYSTTGVVIDATTGAVIGPITGTLSPVHAPASAYGLVVGGAAAVPVPMLAAGTDTRISPSDSGPVWLITAHGTPIAPLYDIGATSCVQVGGYLACATRTGRIAVWVIASLAI